MIRSISLKRKWLPIALIPMMSVAVLSGCDNDSDSKSNAVIGDGNGDGIPDAFQVTTTGGIDGDIADTIDERFAPTSADNDQNGNGIDDSFEPAISGGVDANQDGIDDAALAALTVGDGDTNGENDSTDGGDGGADGGDGGTDGGDGGTDGGDGGTDGGDGGTDGGDGGTDGGDGSTDGGDGGTDGGDGGTDGGTVTNGSLGDIVIGNPDTPVGTADLSWDGSNLSGSVTMNDSTGATSAALYAGMSAALSESDDKLIDLSGTGPRFDYPINLSSDQSDPIAAAMASGNLYLKVETATGPVRSIQLLPPGGVVLATYTNLTSDSGAFSTGAAFLNFNTETGDYTAFLNVNINPEDKDADGNTVTVSAAHIHSQSAAGPVIIPLADAGSGREYKSTGTMNSEQLTVITTNNGWFNTHLNDGSTMGASFLTGQIKIP